MDFGKTALIVIGMQNRFVRSCSLAALVARSLNLEPSLHVSMRASAM
jgi:hypothetical protein